MRRFFRRLASLFCLLLAIACGLFLFVLYRTPAFGKGASYAFYRGGSSSAERVESNSPALDKLLLGKVGGESTCYAGDRYQALKAKYRATLCFTEEACGIVNYYLYSPLLGDGVRLNGSSVNLHIAVSAERTAVGTPLIFGGY